MTKDERKEYIKQLAKETRFRELDLYLFLKDGIITGEKEKDKATLDLISKVFFSRVYVRRMLTYFTRSQRAYLFKTFDMSPAEVFVYKRLENNDVRKIYRELIKQLKQFYNITEYRAKKIISKIARKRKMERYYQRKKQKGETNVNE